MGLFLLCLKIFFVRILDVSMGTLRTIITVKGKTLYASIVGFVEVLIWFIVVKEALNTEETSLWIAVSYSLGFATGTYIGGILSKKLISGNLSVQVITSNTSMEETLRNKGYGVTVIDVEGKDKETAKYMLFIQINKNSMNHLQKLIKDIDNSAFIVVNETKFIENGFINNAIK